MSRTRFLVCLSAFFFACTEPDVIGTPLDDAGAGDGDGGGGAGCELSTDCPAGQVCSPDKVCIADDAPDELKLELVPTAIADEREDQLDFSAGVPIHTHAPATITLGGGGCPDVFKYSYLLDAKVPLFGHEVTPNPLVWKFTASGGSVARAEFRVRTEAGTKLDWTPATPDGDAYVAKIVRSGPTGIPELSSTTGQFFIDMRVIDTEERERMATGCWNHHPLAAPISFPAPVIARGDGSLFDMSLPGNSPVSLLINGPAQITALTTKIAHQTAEPVTLQFDITEPRVELTKSAVTDFIPEVVNQNVFCATTCIPTSNTCVPEQSGDPRCSTATPVDPTDSVVTGVVSSSTWTVKVFDARTLQTASECTVAAARVTCNLPGRTVGSSPKELVVHVIGGQMPELSPAGAGIPIGEHAFLGLVYTGAPITETRFRCDSFSTTAANEDGERFTSCTRFTKFSKLVALDQLKLKVLGPKVNVRTATPAVGGLPATDLVAPPYAANGVVGNTVVWDSGNDDLPGLQH